jgi:hypothetical protein
MGAIRRVGWTAAAAAAGWCFGWMSGAIGHLVPTAANYPFLARRSAPPHHVPQFEGGVSFRFVMAHDVIHERFPRHGAAYYRERDRIAREKLATLSPDDSRAFALADDLGAGLDRLGRPDEAVAILRDKLVRERARGLKGRHFYRTYANLGTFLIHANAEEAAAGDPEARARFREGVDFIHKSVEVNPEAHFGRERWQAVFAEFLLAAMDDPTLLRTFDFLGDRLDLDVGAMIIRNPYGDHPDYGRPYDATFAQGIGREIPRAVTETGPADGGRAWADFRDLRGHITMVGAEEGWENVAVPSLRSPTAFDEPALGIIGMWRQGGGANPHFALAMGEMMLRVGQRFLAWTAFERASRLADRYAADLETQAFLREHCRKRQAAIEATLPDPTAVPRLRPQFEAELAFGEGYEKDYQDFEAAKIAVGAPIDDAHFFDDFPRRGEAVATPVGKEEWFSHVPRTAIIAYTMERRNAYGLFGAGLAAASAVFLMNLVPHVRARLAIRRKPALAAVPAEAHDGTLG